MTDEQTIDFQERQFACPYCGRETVMQSPMDTILVGRATCEHCGSEFLIENDVPGRLPQGAKPPSGREFDLTAQ